MFQTDGAGNDSAYLPLFIASGASHATGLVPDPGAIAGTTNFLREDATWAVPPGGGGTSFQNLQRQTTIIADGQTTTFGILGDALIFGGQSGFTAQIATTTTNNRGASIEETATSSATTTFLHSTSTNYLTGRNIKLLVESYYTTTGDNLNWIYIGDTPGNFFTGIGQATTPAASSGLHYAGFRYANRGGAGPDTTNWKCAHGNAATDTVTDSGVAYDTKGHRFAIIMNDSIPNITYYIDGTLVATHTTSLPAANLLWMLYASTWYATVAYTGGYSNIVISSDL